MADVALDGADRVLPDDAADLEVGLCWAIDPDVAEAYGGATARCHGPDRVSITFTSRATDWTDAVLAATARGVGRAWIRGRLPDKRLAFRWQAVLADAAGSAVAAAVAPSTATPWEDRASLRAWWPVLREVLDEPVSEPLDLREVGDAPGDPPTLPLAGLGATLAETTDLESLPDLTHSKVRSLLDDALGE